MLDWTCEINTWAYCASLHVTNFLLYVPVHSASYAPALYMSTSINLMFPSSQKPLLQQLPGLLHSRLPGSSASVHPCSQHEY